MGDDSEIVGSTPDAGGVVDAVAAIDSAGVVEAATFGDESGAGAAVAREESAAFFGVSAVEFPLAVDARFAVLASCDWSEESFGMATAWSLEAGLLASD